MIIVIELILWFGVHEKAGIEFSSTKHDRCLTRGVSMHQILLDPENEIIRDNDE